MCKPNIADLYNFTFDKKAEQFRKQIFSARYGYFSGQTIKSEHLYNITHNSKYSSKLLL